MTYIKLALFQLDRFVDTSRLYRLSDKKLDVEIQSDLGITKWMAQHERGLMSGQAVYCYKLI